VKHGLLSILMAVVLGASGARAETELPQGDTTILQNDRQEALGAQAPRELPDSIVVTANRFGLLPEKSVWPVTAVSAETIAIQGSLESTLDGRAGVDIRQQSGEGSLSTLSSWGLRNRHMLLLYDGRVVRDYSLGGFSLSNYSSEEVDRLELVKGPQSAFYGADAVGGVINLISRSVLVDRLAVTTKLGSQYTQLYRLDMARSIATAGIGGFAEFARTDNRRDNAGSERVLFGLRGDYLSPDDRQGISLWGRYFSDSLGVPGPVPDRTAVPIHGSEDAWSLYDHQKDENYSFDLRYRFWDRDYGLVRLDLFWEKKNLDYRWLYQDFQLDDVYSRSVYNKRSAGVSGHYMREFSSVAVVGGVDWLSGSIRATQADITRTAGGAVQAHSFWSGSQDQFDVWAGTTVDPARILRFDLSGRLQFVRNRRVQPSYNLGVVCSLSSSLSAKIGYGYAFRLPTIAEQFADEFFTRGSSNLSPETSRSMVGTVSFSAPRSHTYVSGTLFHQTVDSVIQYDYDPDVLKYVPHNVELIRTTGLDLSVGHRLGNSVALQGSLVYQWAEQTTDVRKTYTDAWYVPDLKWRLEAGGDIARPVSYHVDVTYTSDRTALVGGDPKTIEQVYELGASLTVRPWAHLTLILTGLDLTDERRPDNFGYSSGDGGYPTLGRRFFFKTVIDVL